MRPGLLLLGAVVLALPAAPTAARAELLNLDETSVTFEIFGAPAIQFRIPDQPDIVDPCCTEVWDAMVPLISTGVMSLPAGVIPSGTEAFASDLVVGVPLLSGLTIDFAHGDGRLSLFLPSGRNPWSREVGLHLPFEGLVLADALGLFNIGAPLAPIGAGGSATGNRNGMLTLKVTGGAWTSGALRFTGLSVPTRFGGIVHTITRGGFVVVANELPTTTSGFYSAYYEIQVVAPMAVHWGSEGDFDYSFQGVATFRTTVNGRIGFLPEPGVTALLALAGGVLAAARGWRLRHGRA